MPASLLRSSRFRIAVAVPVLAVAAFASPALLPSDAPVPAALKVAEASASPLDCIAVARNTIAVYRGNLGATRQALRNVPGCGGTLSDGVCSASQQWWGGAARATVWAATGGRYTRC